MIPSMGRPMFAAKDALATSTAAAPSLSWKAEKRESILEDMRETRRKNNMTSDRTIRKQTEIKGGFLYMKRKDL